MKRLFCALIKIIAWIVCRFIPIDSNKIVISSYYGRGYGDNPKYIVEELLKYSDQLSIIWLVKNDEEKKNLPTYIKPCRYNSVQSICHLSTAKIWIDNCRKGFVMFKRKKQYYIQTWHGFAIKRIEKDAEKQLSAYYVKCAKRDSKMIDVAVSDSSHMTRLYKESFWYKGEVLECGAPRNDVIIKNSDSLKDKIFATLNIESDRKLVLYAPTFRSNLKNDAYLIDYKRLKLSCEKRFGGEFSILVRLHPNVIKNSESMQFDGTECINASYYPDMQELLAVSDVVVSDYSSLMVDYSLSGRPCFQFASDIEDYKKDRDFYFNIENLPYMLSETNDELETSILAFDEIAYQRAIDEFLTSVGMIKHSNAAHKCAELILKTCGIDMDKQYMGKP